MHLLWKLWLFVGLSWDHVLSLHMFPILLLNTKMLSFVLRVWCIITASMTLKSEFNYMVLHTWTHIRTSNYSFIHYYHQNFKDIVLKHALVHQTKPPKSLILQRLSILSLATYLCHYLLQFYWVLNWIWFCFKSVKIWSIWWDAKPVITFSKIAAWINTEACVSPQVPKCLSTEFRNKLLG